MPIQQNIQGSRNIVAYAILNNKRMREDEVDEIPYKRMREDEGDPR